MKLSKRLMVHQSSGLWTPAQISKLLWMDDSGEDGTDFNGAAPYASAKVAPSLYCAMFFVLDTSSISEVQIVAEHSENSNNYNGSFLSSIGESAGYINFGFHGSNGYHTIKYPISSGSLNCGLLSIGYKNLAAYNNGSQLTGTTVLSNGTSFASTLQSKPMYLSARNMSQYQLLGTMREYILLNSVPSTDIQQKIEGYLAHKWDRILGVSTRVSALPSGHPYKTTAP